MALEFSPISSPGGVRDVFVDLSGALENEETLTLATVTSVHPSILAVTNVDTNPLAVTVDGKQVAVGRGVHFTVETLQQSQASVGVLVEFEGSDGTVDRYEIAQPIVPALCN